MAVIIPFDKQFALPFSVEINLVGLLHFIFIELQIHIHSVSVLDTKYTMQLSSLKRDLWTLRILYMYFMTSYSFS
jgi:hypothetical protein